MYLNVNCLLGYWAFFTIWYPTVYTDALMQVPDIWPDIQEAGYPAEIQEKILLDIIPEFFRGGGS